MTTFSKTITAVVFSLVTILAALVLSMGSTAYAGGYEDHTGKASLVNVAGVVQSPTSAPTTPMLSSESYYTLHTTTVACDVCPASLPPTSGQISTIEALGYMLVDMFNSLFS